jgi:hypothetical protein
MQFKAEKNWFNVKPKVEKSMPSNNIEKVKVSVSFGFRDIHFKQKFYTLMIFYENLCKLKRLLLESHIFTNSHESYDN